MKNFDISQISLPQLESELIQTVSISEKLGLDWAKKQSMFEQLEDFKKHIWASNAPNDGSEASKDRVAYASEGYKNHLYGLSAAREDATAARVKYDASKAKLDALRTIISNHREMTKRFI